MTTPRETQRLIWSFVWTVQPEAVSIASIFRRARCSGLSGIAVRFERAAPLKIPSPGGVARMAGVGFRINNPHQVVGHDPKTPLKSPLVQGGTLFSSSVAPQRGMKNSFELAAARLKLSYQ